jgi:hypothetical protein
MIREGWAQSPKEGGEDGNYIRGCQGITSAPGLLGAGLIAPASMHPANSFVVVIHGCFGQDLR